MYDDRQGDQAHYLSFSFTALGLAYWLHHFDASQFRVIRYEDRANLSSEATMGYLETTFGYSPMPPKCKHARDWIQTNECTAQARYKQARQACAPGNLHGALPPEDAIERNGGFSKGTDASLVEFRALAARWDTALHNLIADKKVTIYNPRSKRYEHISRKT